MKKSWIGRDDFVPVGLLGYKNVLEWPKYYKSIVENSHKRSLIFVDFIIKILIFRRFSIQKSVENSSLVTDRFTSALFSFVVITAASFIAIVIVIGLKLVDTRPLWSIIILISLKNKAINAKAV